MKQVIVAVGAILVFLIGYFFGRQHQRYEPCDCSLEIEAGIKAGVTWTMLFLDEGDQRWYGHLGELQDLAIRKHNEMKEKK